MLIRLIKKDSNGNYLLKGKNGLYNKKKDQIKKKKSQDKLFLACLLESDPVGFMVLNETSPDCGQGPDAYVVAYLRL